MRFRVIDTIVCQWQWRKHYHLFLLGAREPYDSSSGYSIIHEQTDSMEINVSQLHIRKSNIDGNIRHSQ